MASVYIYVVKYDFGFAPNPFDGVCTFACCKPVIRRVARPGDWLIGMGGKNLKATGCCIFAMQVTGAMTFDEYWLSPRFRIKRPVRNGSRRSMVGDNIYWRAVGNGVWQQEDSIHSRPDGTQDAANTDHDTHVNRILTSEHFIYFGRSAPAVPADMLLSLDYVNRRGHRVYNTRRCADLLKWIAGQAGGTMNRVIDKPFQFSFGNKRYSRTLDRVI